MPALRDMEIGVMFWAGPDPVEVIRGVKALGVRCGQLGVPGEMRLDPATSNAWKAALDSEDFTLVTVFAAYVGESYADAPTVQKTVGFIPPATREEREKRTYEISDFAAALGVPGIACHIGFVPEDRSHPDYVAVRDIVRRVCDYAARHGQTFALETGQEPANVLLAFFKDVDRPNLRINFDPANLIMYGTGDPIAALDLLGPYIVSVHAKDGEWPAKDVPGALGVEKPLGQGAVGIEKFIAKLKAIGYKGTLNIEREIEDQQQRHQDIKIAVGYLQRLVAA
jgi:sugar phosphate isomerase/epimerase